MKDHAPLFAALAVLFLAGLVASVFLADDPIRGLLLGASPTVLALVVWALTNRAGYPNRAPDTLAHERSALAADGPIEEANTWDPFEDQRQQVVGLAPDGAEQTVGSGDPFSAAAQQPTRPILKPGQSETPAAPTQGAERSRKAHRRDRRQASPPPPSAAKPSSDPDPSKAPNKSAQSKAGGKTRSRPTHPSPDPAAKDPTDATAEYLSPAEAAKRDAATRKPSSRTRKGKPDTAA